MNRKLCFIGFALMLLLVSFISASDVAYIYKSKARIDSNVVNVLTNMNLNVDFILESSLPKDFSKYRFILIGDEYFANDIPVNDYRSIILNHYFGNKYGLTNRNGISTLSSRIPLEVSVNGQSMQIYTSEKDSRGDYLSYYFLGDQNKASYVDTFAQTYSISSGRTGDVISFVDKNTNLLNGKISKGEICFFGAVESDYWTAEGIDLFKDCVNFVNKVQSENVTICSKDSDCSDNNSNTEDKCLNPGTVESLCSHQFIGCLNDISCGTNGLIGFGFCSNNNVFKNYVTYKCNNPGTNQSSCSNESKFQLIQTCSDSCNNGLCQEVRCKNNSQCNDGNSSTEDICLNSGKASSSCIYKSHTDIIYIKFVSVSASPAIYSVSLNFSAVLGNSSGLRGYYLSKDRLEYVFVSGAKSSYIFENLNASTDYTFFVSAVDMFNISSDEVNISVRTLDVSNNNGGGGGGGGSGGSSSSSFGSGAGGLCVTDWSCTEWSSCKDSKQTRSCYYPPNFCNPEQAKPSESQGCVEAVLTTNNISNTQEEVNQSENVSMSGSGITGAVVGALGKYSLWLVIGFLAVIAGIYTFLRFRK